MNFKKLATKMFVCILPVIIIAMVLLTFISVSSSKSIITDQISETMDARLSAEDGNIRVYLDSVSNMATTIARFVETQYKDVPMDTFINSLSEAIMDNDIVLGSGLWFEPFAFDPSEEYMGPYVYKDGSELVVTYDYSNAEYDYFTQEYYTQCIDATAAQFTDPYYDPTSDCIMSSCSMPLRVDGKYLGCVTVDIELSSITRVIGDIKIGQSGSGMFITSDGTYIAGVDPTKVQNAVKITEDDNASLAALGAQVLASSTGSGTYDLAGNTFNVYWTTNESTGWKLLIQIAQAEVNAPATMLMFQLMIICVVAVLLTVAVVFFMVRSITKSIKKVQSFAGTLADGDFRIDPLTISSKDEIGQMGESLNSMFASNKSVISTIKVHSTSIDEASSKLEEATKVLSENFEQIKDHMNSVNNDMLTTSAATEQLNASSEEVLSNTNILVSETDACKSLSTDIRGRAEKVGSSSREAYDSAIALADDFAVRLQSSMENAKVVDNIGILAASISSIAEQINLLSLNASIEAARAGESGRGFAVVATEIGKLATSTSDSVAQIQNTISEVQTAFNKLTADSESLLSFIQETVAPDYKKFVDVANQYGSDAEIIAESSDKISSISDTIKYVMKEVADAVQDIANATQSTTELSTKILFDIEAAGVDVTDMADMAQSERSIAGDLSETISKFSL